MIWLAFENGRITLRRMEDRHHSPMDDPLGFMAVDRETQINKLKQHLQLMAGGEAVFGPADCDPEIEEAFLTHVLAFESETGVRPMDLLKRDGFRLQPPRELSDTALSRQLWKTIRALAEYRLFIERTDHLSNRELYTWLWNEVLPNEYPGLGMLPGDWHVDVLGGCSEDDLILSMRYYSSAEERECWAHEFPDFPMPPCEKPPYDRDRRLPQPELPL